MDCAREPERRAADFWAWFDGKKTNDLRPDEWERAEPRSPGYAITGSGRRRAPSAASKRLVLSRQGNRCLYCDHVFGTTVWRRGRPVTLRLNWDHFIPYSYGLTNASANWAAACHVCNGIKSCRVFDTVAEAQRFILVRWAEKGYQLQHPLQSAEAVQ